jgi:hypothetical protein
LAVCALVTLGCYVYWAGMLAPDMAETVPSHVGEAIPGGASIWPSFVPREDRGEDYQAKSTAIPYCLFLLVLFGAYGLAARTVAGHSSRLLGIAVFGAAAVFLVVLATTPFMLAADVYSYAAYGRIFALYHIDPAAEAVKLPADDPFPKLWGEQLPPSSYGPAWTLISAGVAICADKNVGLTVLLYRGLAVAAVLATAGLIGLSLRRIAPARVIQGTLLFLWNPLVILESAVSGHNDAMMAAFFVAGIALHLRGRRLLPLVCFSLSVLVKFATAPLVPIYVVMVLRQLPNWRVRIGSLAQAAVVGTLTLAAAVVPVHFIAPTQSAAAVAKTGPSKPLYGWWIFEQGYINSPHELLFRALRQQMGEEPDDVGDVEFSGWWITTNGPTNLHATTEEEGPLAARIMQGTSLLVIQPRVDHTWLRVYDPATGNKGYVLEDETTVTQRPAFAERDLVLLRWEAGRSPTAVRADFVVKLAGWSAFGLAWLAALVYASNLRRFLLAATSLLLASYWLINSAFYAWYVIWALALAALVPASAPTLFALLLSALALTIYATTGYDAREGLEWIFAYRSVPIFALPPILFVCVYGIWSRRSDRSPAEGVFPPLSSPAAIQAR